MEKLRGTDIVVADGIYFCPVLLAEYLDALRVDFFTVAFLTPISTLYFVPSPLSYVPNMRTGSTDRMNFLERLKNVLVWLVTSWIQRTLYYAGHDAMKAKHSIKPGLSALESKQNAELVLFANDFALDIPQPLNPGTTCC